ncbi:hypothetical protein KY285_030205 [Solanum tuberosum]|nr:hypothetical protein KY285_030205 [Solanum tuberosum]
MMSYMSLVFTDGCFAYDLELTPVKQEKIVKGKRDGDWFVLGLVGVVFAGASCFVVVSLVAVISGLFLVVVLVGEEVEKEGIWLKLLVVFGVGSCWLFEVEAGSLVRCCCCWFVGEHGNGVISSSFGSRFWWFRVISPVEFFGAASCYYCCRWQQTKREAKEAWVFGSGFFIARASPDSECW